MFSKCRNLQVFYICLFLLLVCLQIPSALSQVAEISVKNTENSAENNLENKAEDNNVKNTQTGPLSLSGNEQTSINALTAYWINLHDVLDQGFLSRDRKLALILDDNFKKIDLVGGLFTNKVDFRKWLKQRQDSLFESKHIQHDFNLLAREGSIVEFELMLEVETKPKASPREVYWSKERWKVQIRQDSMPQIIEITEEYIDPLSNSGAQIQC